MTCRLRWYVQNRNQNSNMADVWANFMACHPIATATLQGAATWWIHCHDSRATCHIAGWSHMAKSMSWSCHIAGCNNSIRHIENRFSPYFILFLFFNAVSRLGFDERRLLYRLRYTCFSMLSVVTTREMETTRGRDDKDRPLMKSAATAACMMSSETLSTMLFIVSLTLSYR